MKVGYSAYGSARDVYEFLFVGGYIHVISYDFGFLGCASTPEGVLKLIKKETDPVAIADIIDATTHAINDLEDVEPVE